MTILDLMRLIKRYVKLVIFLPVLFAVVALFWSFFVQVSYTATANFITSSDLAFAQGLTSNQIALYSEPGVTLACSSQSATKQVTVTAKGSDPTACINAANAIVNNTVSNYRAQNSNVVLTVTEADTVVRNESSPIQTCLIALLAGFAVAVVIIVLMDIAKAPIKSREDAESVCDLPILGTATSMEGADRILANLEFCCNRRPLTTAVVPVGDAASATKVSDELVEAFIRSNVRAKLVKGSPHARKFKVSVPEDAAVVVCCPPLTAGAGATYIANNSDATILCVVAWADSKRQLLSTIRELRLAKANIAGLAYLPEDDDAKIKAKVAKKEKRDSKKKR